MPGIHIHHVDGNPFNNEIRNLMACTAEEHLQAHLEMGDKIQDNYILRADWYDNATEEIKARHRKFGSRNGHKALGVPKPTLGEKVRKRMKDQGISKPLIIKDFKTGKVVDKTESILEASVRYNIQRAHIRRVLKGERKSCKGLCFEFSEN